MHFTIPAGNAYVLMKNGTLLEANTGEKGNSIYKTKNSTLEYQLPAPLGRWVFAREEDDWISTEVMGKIDSDYPYACNAGLLGQSNDPNEQSSPRCSGSCPAG